MFTQALNGREADLERLNEKIVSEITAMDYTVCSEPDADGFILTVSRDVGGIDTFLGRWQRSKIKIYCIDGIVHMDIIGRDCIDKTICFIIGPLFLAIPWIFGLIARSNRKNMEQVIYKLVSDHMTKIRLA